MKLKIMNEQGHTDLDVNTSEMIEQIAEHPSHWVYVDGDMVAREKVNEVSWDAVDSVVLALPIVGGNQ